MTEKSHSRCQHVKVGGKRCQGYATSGSSYCFFHDPKSAKKRKQAQKAGGQKHRARTLPLETPDVTLETAPHLVSFLGETINQVRRGELDPRVANAIGYLAGIMLKGFEQIPVEGKATNIVFSWQE